MSKQNLQKLELTWIGKNNEPKLEPRILIEDPSKSFGDSNTENMLIHGDNLLALKALEQDFTGKIKCICIDPPYNTGSAFEHYDDGIQHSLWLSLITPRLRLLHKLLKEDGSIWISIDDNECHYLKILLDEIFGRRNFITSVIWQKKYAPKSDSKFLSESHDYIIFYAKNINKVNLNRLPKTEKQTNRYKNYDNDKRGPWKPDNVLRNEYREYAYFPVCLPNGVEVFPPPGTSWRYTKEKFAELIKDNRIWFGKDGSSRPAYKRFISDVSPTIPAMTIWQYDEVGHNDEAKKEARKFNEESVFGTPKPERLINRILELGSNENDLVLDSFLGSGTSAAVAHKMKRKWIGIELGEHAITHCLPRLKKVVDGEDKGGITEIVNWKGGGGFKFYTLAPSLIKKDKYGSEIINTAYNADMLAAAMAKQEGFRYSPDENSYWKQGFSTEKDFIFTTTQFVTVEILDRLAEELKSGESLLVCCKSFSRACTNKYGNITIKKIPQMLLGRCEFDKDDYSLKIVNLPNSLNHDENDLPDDYDFENHGQPKSRKNQSADKRKKKKDDENQPSLF
jgi:adenine-specific DNA-methyltransferase